MSKLSHLALLIVVVLASSSLLAADPATVPNAAAPDDIQVDVGGVKVSIDRTTGRMRNLPTEEARKLQQEILRSFKLTASATPYTSETGLTIIEHDDRDMHWYLGTVETDGDFQFSCVNTLGDVTATILRSMTRPAAPQQPVVNVKERE